ncbi:hypothetical protein NSU_3837 [Novosphingobium pentaromativorans US6-1]|uniref:Uncharacterized protein n=1 Tax=Novosphingobium pentaromativorans US6-1 TaxID=1088721 RepID=G6EHL6_9SPHN|nr:hypothetical protein NSU_3837 [Novosphingobium pentaromativorans US6-1]
MCRIPRRLQYRSRKARTAARYSETRKEMLSAAMRFVQEHNPAD